MSIVATRYCLEYELDMLAPLRTYYVSVHGSCLVLDINKSTIVVLLGSRRKLVFQHVQHVLVKHVLDLGGGS
jgi:hypothetical protein